MEKGKFETIGHLHDEFILLLRPESFRILLSCTNWGFCYLNLTEIIKLKYQRKNEKVSGRSSKMAHRANCQLVTFFKVKG